MEMVCVSVVCGVAQCSVSSDRSRKLHSLLSRGTITDSLTRTVNLAVYLFTSITIGSVQTVRSVTQLVLLKGDSRTSLLYSINTVTGGQDRLSQKKQVASPHYSLNLANLPAL